MNQLRTPGSGLRDVGKVFLLSAFCVLSSELVVRADVPVPLPNVPLPNGQVGAIAMSSSTVYFSGDFHQIGSYTGGGVVVNTQTGNLQQPFPQVNGEIDAVVADGSGGWYIGGSFTQVSGVAIGALAHILPNGTLDTTWNPTPGPIGAPGMAVYALALNGTTLYVGGSFLSMGSQTRQFAAAVNTTNGLPTSWNPNADNSVFDFALSGSVIYVGGAFENIGGQARNALAALDTSAGNATSWNPDVQGMLIGIQSSHVESMLLDGTTLYIGGDFTSAGGQAVSEVAALNTNTGLSTGWNPIANDQVSVFVLSGTTLYVGGWFTTIAGQARGALASFNKNTGKINSWNPNAQYLSENTATGVLSLVVSGSTVYAGGNFDTINGQSRANLAAVDATSGNASSWNPNMNNEVWALGLNSTGLYVGGTFSSAGPAQVRNYLAAVDLATGNLLSWNPNPNNTVGPIVVSGSVVYVGGTFTTIGGQTRNGLAALNAATGNATTWNPNPSGGSPDTEVDVLTSSGTTLYVSGLFASIGGQTRKNVAAVDMGTGNANAWNPSLYNPNPQPPVLLSMLVSGTTLYIGGTFSSVDGNSRASAAAYNTTNNTVLPWNPNPQTTIPGYKQASVVKLATDGIFIYAGGNFTSIGGQSRNLLAALDASAGNATAWNPNVWYNPPPGAINDSEVWAIQPYGSVVYAGGEFNSVGGGSYNYYNLVALDSTTATGLPWTPNPNNLVFALALNNSILSVGGDYEAISGANYSNFSEFSVSGTQFPPVITSSTTAIGITGSSFTYQITATNNPTSFNAAPLPAGLTVNASNGVISGTPTVAGISSVTLTANNSVGQGNAGLTLTIYSACDLNQDNPTNVVDVQLEVNMALGVIPCTGDINKDGSCNVVDLQRVVNAALGGQCVTGP